MEAKHELDRLFYPRSIAVVGASPRSALMTQGNNYIKGSVSQNFPGKIYPVHPKAQSILGFKAYSSIREIPDEVDLAIFTIPATAVLDVMEDCVAKRVRFVHLFTAGFSETEREQYADIERKLVALARENGIRIIGPNCMGIYCPEGGLSFQPFLPTRTGPVGFFSQSGQLAAHFIMKCGSLGLGLSKVVSFGNASDLKAHDFLEYLARDDKTQLIGSYLEGLKDGREFLELARSVTLEKPLVIFKGGRTRGGSRATRSHTGAIAGSPRIWEAVCRQAGILSVDSLEELSYTLSALMRLPLPRGNRVAILGGAGGGSVTMADQAECEGLRVPRLSDDSIRSLERFIPHEGSSVRNPLDVGFAAFAPDNFPRLMEVLKEEPNIDALILEQRVGLFDQFLGRSMRQNILKLTVEMKERLEKPLFLVLERDDSFGGEDALKEAEAFYRQARMPTFPSFDLAAKILSKMDGYRKHLDAMRGGPT